MLSSRTDVLNVHQIHACIAVLPIQVFANNAKKASDCEKMGNVKNVQIVVRSAQSLDSVKFVLKGISM